uniref:Major facilitator superfamily (MFS) profile domain-containing protein n=1 Tax=Bionectria ochroleuca TaxID=29856 RepID=A0A8H7N3A8_BIOOC
MTPPSQPDTTQPNPKETPDPIPASAGTAHDLLQNGEANAKPWWRTPHLLQLNALMLSPLLTIIAWGFDISMTNALQSLSAFNEKFGNPEGARLGLYGASTQIGGMATIFVSPWLVQRFGRRVSIAGGCLMIIAMAVMQTFSTSLEMFIAGKILLGFGSVAVQISAPVLITELAYPTHRSRITALYNTLIYVGFILGSWSAFGTRNIHGDRSWQIPCVLQAALPAYQVLTIFFCPESPRWLVSKGQEKKAREILIKYHGGGVETPLVQAEMEEIRAGIEADASQVRFNKKDIMDLLSHRGNQRRLLLTTVTAVGSQACGSGLISAYLPQVLNNIGMKTTQEQTLIAGIVNIWSWFIGIAAAVFINRFNKRFMFLFGTGGMIIAFSVWTALAARYEVTESNSFGLGVVAMIFVYNFFYGLISSLTVSYPLEICTTKQRSLFFSWNFFSISMSTFIVNYINPIGIKNLSWRYYLLTIAFTSLIWLIIYFTFVDTKGMSLEEIATIFDGKDGLDVARSAVHIEDTKTSALVEEDEGRPTMTTRYYTTQGTS